MKLVLVSSDYRVARQDFLNHPKLDRLCLLPNFQCRSIHTSPLYTCSAFLVIAPFAFSKHCSEYRSEYRSICRLTSTNDTGSRFFESTSLSLGMARDLGVSDQYPKELTKSESILYGAQTSWTAARCQRLLRPLSSKIALLRKERQCNPGTEDFKQAHDVFIDGAPKPQGQAPDQGSRRRTVCAGDVADEEWAPNPRPRKRLKRTYSSKNLTIQRPVTSSQTSAIDQSVQSRIEIVIPDNLFRQNAQSITKDLASDWSQPLGPDFRDNCSGQNLDSQKDGEHHRLPWSDASRSRYCVKLSFQQRLTDGICSRLDALLKTTKHQEVNQVRVRGSRSLFATCLRKVPDLIAQEESWYKMEDPESNVDVSSMIYSDLESISTSTSGGWMPLRQIVRAHGVSMVGSAICEGLIGFDTASGIFARCCLAMAYDEAEHILRCLIQAVESLQNPYRIPVEIRYILHSLNVFVLASGRHSFRYRQLTWLLGSGRLPLEWIGRPDMIEIWNKVVQSIAQNDDHAGPATELFRLAISTAYGCCGQLPATLIHSIRLRRQGLAKEANAYIVSLGYQTRWPRASQIGRHDEGHDVHNEKALSTISSVLTVLCAIELLRSAGQPSSSNSTLLSGMPALGAVAIDAQHMFELASDRVLSIQGDRMTLPLLAAGLVQATLCRNQQMFAATVPVLFDTLAGLVDSELAVEEGGSFLCAVADCCARAKSEEVYDHTQKTVQHIRHIAESLKSLSASHELCNRMGLAAALEYAEKTKHPKHLHWALDVEQALLGAHLDSTRRTPLKTPLRDRAQIRNGYRWEAGICEWVAKTPAIGLTKPLAQGQRAGSTRSFGESPIRIPQDSGRKSMESPHLSSNQISEANPARWPVYAVDQDTCMSTGEVGEATQTLELSPKKVLFSHVYIARAGDELSVCAPPQEPRSSPSPRLREITNSATNSKQSPRDLQRQMTKGTRCLSEQALCTTGGICYQELALESEDELSYLQ